MRPWRGTGSRSWSSGSSAGWRSAGRPSSGRCYRGDHAGREARTPGGAVPVQRRLGHPAGVPVELPGRPRAVRPGRVALEARHSGRAGGPVFPRAVRHSAEPRWLARRGRSKRRGRCWWKSASWIATPKCGTFASGSVPNAAGQGQPLFIRKYRLPIFLAVSIGVFNQLSGINAILDYLNGIFERAGFNKVSGDLQAVAIGSTNLMFTIIAISVIDRDWAQETAAHGRRRYRRLSGRGGRRIRERQTRRRCWSGCW